MRNSTEKIKTGVCVKELDFDQIVNFGLGPVMQYYVIQNSVCSWQDIHNPLPHHQPTSAL